MYFSNLAFNFVSRHHSQENAVAAAAAARSASTMMSWVAVLCQQIRSLSVHSMSTNMFSSSSARTPSNTPDVENWFFLESRESARLQDNSIIVLTLSYYWSYNYSVKLSIQFFDSSLVRTEINSRCYIINYVIIIVTWLCVCVCRCGRACVHIRIIPQSLPIVQVLSKMSHWWVSDISTMPRETEKSRDHSLSQFPK